MNGTIIVQSIYGKGSKFTISIDQRIISLDTPLAKQPAVSQSTIVDANGAKLLIVDDNEMNIKGKYEQYIPAQSKLLSQMCEKIAKDLADQATLPDKYQITGIVSEITYAYSGQYQNISFRLSDGSKTILCYRAKGTDASKIKVGDTITLVGNIKNYYGEIEVINGVISKRVAGN